MIMDEFSFINENLALFIIYAGLAFVMFLTAWFGMHRWLNRWRVPALVLCFAVFLGVSYVGLGELLGRAKPVDIMSWDRPDVESASVEGAFFIQGKAIFLWLIYEGLEAPRYYQFPWSRAMAEKLQDGMYKKGKGDIQELNIKLPFQHSWENRDIPELYETPWPKPPGKDEEQQDIIDLNAIEA
jgi:hypothetical protein